MSSKLFGWSLGVAALLALAVLFGLAGIHHAFEQSLEKSLAAELLPGELRGTGFGVLATANGIGDLFSSVVVGTLWSAVNPAAGFLYAAVFAVVGAVIVYSSGARRASPN